MNTDTELLRTFIDKGDEAAFAEVVRRQADLVYSVALRVTRNPALARDATQTVFTILAREARSLVGYDTLVGWLHTTARHTAINLVRGEERRRAREQEATLMQNEIESTTLNWEAVGPLLDEAVDALAETDRKAILLRFFQNQSHQEVGAVLGLGEDAARKRVDRALEKLRTHFARMGVAAPSALLATVIASNSVQAAPSEVVTAATSGALSGAVTAGVAGGGFLATFMMSTPIKIFLAVVAILAVTAVMVFKSHGPQHSSTPAVTIPAKGLQPVAAAPESVSTSTTQVEAPKASVTDVSVQQPSVEAVKISSTPAVASAPQAAASTGTATTPSRPRNNASTILPRNLGPDPTPQPGDFNVGPVDFGAAPYRSPGVTRRVPYTQGRDLVLKILAERDGTGQISGLAIPSSTPVDARVPSGIWGAANVTSGQPIRLSLINKEVVDVVAQFSPDPADFGVKDLGVVDLSDGNPKTYTLNSGGTITFSVNPLVPHQVHVATRNKENTRGLGGGSLLPATPMPAKPSVMELQNEAVRFTLVPLL